MEYMQAILSLILSLLLDIREKIKLYANFVIITKNNIPSLEEGDTEIIVSIISINLNIQKI